MTSDLFLDQNSFTVTNPELLLKMTSSEFYNYYQRTKEMLWMLKNAGGFLKQKIKKTLSH